MNINPLILLEKAINEHGSATILRQRLELVKEMLAKVEKEKADCVKKLSDAHKEIEELTRKLPSPNFVEYRGSKFKRKPSGGYEHTVYCPSCNIAMTDAFEGKLPFACPQCPCRTPYNAHDLDSVLAELLKEYP